MDTNLYINPSTDDGSRGESMSAKTVRIHYLSTSAKKIINLCFINYIQSKVSPKTRVISVLGLTFVKRLLAIRIVSRLVMILY